MIEYEYYDWTSLINVDARQRMVTNIDTVIASGDYWKNSPPYQTNINIFGLPTEDWINLKMSFIWSCFAYMRQEKQIKSVKSWGYKTNVDTQEDRNNYWHQHLRDGSIVLSGVYYVKLPEGCNLETSGTELAHTTPEGTTEYVPAREGHWLIFPGKTWHRPGILETNNWRYIVAADMEI
jgi:N6-adenosine-specific RNA methylase IME4